MILKKNHRGANTNDFEVNFVAVNFKEYAVNLPISNGGEYHVPTIRDIYGDLLSNIVTRLVDYIKEPTNRKGHNIQLSNSLVEIRGNLIGIDTVFGMPKSTIEYSSKALFKRKSKYELETFKEEICHDSVVSRIGDNIIQMNLLYESLSSVQKKYPQGLKVKKKIDQLLDLPFYCLRIPVGFIGCPSSNHEFMVSGYVNPLVSTSELLDSEVDKLPDESTFFLDPLVYPGSNEEKVQILPVIEKAFNDIKITYLSRVCSNNTIVRKVRFEKQTVLASPLIVDMLKSLSPFMIGNPHLFASLTATKYFSVDEQIVYNIKELAKKLGLSRHESLDLVSIDVEYSANSFESVLRNHISKHNAYLIDRLIIHWLSDLDGGIKCTLVSDDESEVVNIPHLVELIASNGYIRWVDQLEVQYNDQWYKVSEQSMMEIFGPLDVESNNSMNILNVILGEDETGVRLKEELVISLRDIINLIYILNSDIEDVSTVMIGTELNFSLPSKVIRNSSHYGIYKGNRVQE